MVFKKVDYIYSLTPLNNLFCRIGNWDYNDSIYMVLCKRDGLKLVRYGSDSLFVNKDPDLLTIS